jgi:hypothetical protein
MKLCSCLGMLIGEVDEATLCCQYSDSSLVKQ